MWLKENVGYFKHFDNITLQNLVKCFVQVEFAKDDVIMKKGDTGRSMFIILEGECGIYLHDDDVKSKRHKVAAVNLW